MNERLSPFADFTLHCWSAALRIACVFALGCFCTAAPSAGAESRDLLTPEQIAQGWVSLFDGETLFGWRSNNKNVDWQEGDSFEVKHINPRHPNVLQLINDEGETTFVEHYDVVLDEQVAERPGEGIESPISNKYLLWP